MIRFRTEKREKLKVLDLGHFKKKCICPHDVRITCKIHPSHIFGEFQGTSYIKIKPVKVPLMVATMIAKWVADAFDEHGIYDKHIILNNYPFLDCKTEYRYSTLACDVMRPRPEEPNSSFCVLTGEGMSIQEIDDILKRNSYNGFPGKNLNYDL